MGKIKTNTKNPESDRKFCIARRLNVGTVRPEETISPAALSEKTRTAGVSRFIWQLVRYNRGYLCGSRDYVS